ncbi:ABC transporter permease [Azospirillum agricola]|uniref:ABC transporter permease n=1 Tax=Azospirillum agricola TaxID=1720247 RepID=UPI000A0EEEA8|nr:ABC transporter permease [Azospirillum agricola]SMH54285.1 NitT/TauT family transport system permease protein [Azospirillum lipoferum]
MTPRAKAVVDRSMPLLSAVGLFVVWELACRLFAVPEYLLPTPSASFLAAWTYRDAIWMHALQTLLTTLGGFALAVAFGVLLGALVGSSRAVYRAANPLLIGFNSVPKVAVVPILVMWFGIGTVPAVLTAFLISFFPIVVNVATGLATLEPELRDVLRSLGATRTDILLKVGFPRALPFFFASLKVAVTLAFVGSVMSETVASNLGVGYLMMSASSRFNMPLVFAGLLVIAAMGIAMYGAFSVIEHRSTRWAHRGGESL